MIVTNYTPEDLKKLPLRAIVALAARCSRRVEGFALLPEGHSEKERCRIAVGNAIALAEDYAKGEAPGKAEAVVNEIEEARRVAQCDLVHDSALATFSLAARAAMNALHAGELSTESVDLRSAGSHGPDPIGHLADLTADVAARAAFTAAFEAVAADGHSDAFVTAAINDYQKLLELDLGKYPGAGKPIDPSSRGPLGPLGPLGP